MAFKTSVGDAAATTVQHAATAPSSTGGTVPTVGRNLLPLVNLNALPQGSGLSISGALGAVSAAAGAAPVHAPAPNFFQTVGNAFNAEGKRIGDGIKNTVAHASTIPGVILNGVLQPVFLGQEGLALAGQAIGKATGDATLLKASNDVLKGVHDVQVVDEKDPKAVAEVIGGGVMIVAGLATGGTVSAAGIALAGKGVAEIASDVITMEAAQSSAPPAVPPAQAAASSQTSAPVASSSSSARGSFWQAFTRR